MVSMAHFIQCGNRSMQTNNKIKKSGYLFLVKAVKRTTPHRPNAHRAGGSFHLWSQEKSQFLTNPQTAKLFKLQPRFFRTLK
ncbi:hypothetical protein FKM82_022204 [Ascaphus truei]